MCQIRFWEAAAVSALAQLTDPTAGPVTSLVQWQQQPAYAGFIAWQAGQVVGYICWQQGGDEVDILYLWVAPAQRRHGVAQRLLQALVQHCQPRQVRAIFLEVAVDNPAALALYQRWGATPVSRRRGYYARPTGAVDALVLQYSGPWG